MQVRVRHRLAVFLFWFPTQSLFTFLRFPKCISTKWRQIRKIIIEGKERYYYLQGKIRWLGVGEKNGKRDRNLSNRSNNSKNLFFLLFLAQKVIYSRARNETQSCCCHNGHFKEEEENGALLNSPQIFWTVRRRKREGKHFYRLLLLFLRGRKANLILVYCRSFRAVLGAELSRRK